MILWMTSETMADVGSAVNNAKKQVETHVNQFLKEADIDDIADEWMLILIVMVIDLEKSFPEGVRKINKGKILEFRLQMPHKIFLAANEKEQVTMVFDCLFRSIDLMVTLKVKQETQAALRTVLAKARQSLSA